MKQLFTLLLTTTIFITLSAQPGTLDKSYGNGGIVIGQNYSGDCSDLIIQKEGKVISVGTGGYGKLTSGFLLVRYNTDGTPDLSFGDSGRAATQYGAGVSYGALQADGKIVVAGVVGRRVGDGNNLAVVRFNANGGIDSSFGTNGLIVESLTKQYDNPCGIVIQPDGKIVVAGATIDYSDFDAVAPTIYLVRYNEDGSHDESFGKKGIYQEEAGAFDIAGLALQPDGKLLVGGDDFGDSGFPFFVRRYKKNGAPDVEFGVKGEARYYCDNADYGSTLSTIALQPDGKIIAAGSTYSGNGDGNPLATLVRLNSDGSTDNEFGKKGMVTSVVGKYGSEIHDLTLQPDGRIVAAVNDVDINKLGSIAFAVTRYLSNGEPDSSFGENGVQTTVIGSQPYSDAIALQKDGKIILGGYSLTESFETSYVTLARYNGDNTKQPLTVRIKRWLLHHGISWQAQPNKDVRYYTVQRSADNIVYKEIARLSNKTQVDKYEDAATITGSSYYRLAAIGWDGSRTYSNTVLIDESTNVKVFPNPVRDNLQLQGLQSGKTSVSIVDLQGNVRSSSVAGGANYSVNTSQLTPGNYLLKLQHNNVTTTLPFVKE